MGVASRSFPVRGEQFYRNPGRLRGGGLSLAGTHGEENATEAMLVLLCGIFFQETVQQSLWGYNPDAKMVI